MKTKWNNEFFARIGLIPAFWLYSSKQYGHTLEDYLAYMKNKQKTSQARKEQRAKEKGATYYTPELVRNMQYVQRLAKY